MRVCHIVPSLEKRHGGPSVSVPALALAQARAGHHVDLLATGPGAMSAAQEGTLNTRVFALQWPRTICASAGLAAALNASEAEVFHHHALWLRPLHHAHAAARHRRARLVISPRGMMSPWAWNHHRLRKLLAGALVHPGALAAAQGWHATSAGEADEIRSLGFTQPVCVAPNGVDLPTPGSLQAAAADWRRRCPATNDRPVALFYSRFHRKKRLRELLDLWLGAARGDWLLLLVGVPEEYTVAEVQGWIDAAGARDRVAVFAGTDLPPPYAVASLFVLPSHSENFGLVVAEAMAAGVPVVVTDTTPWSGVNADERGWCVPWAEFGGALARALDEGRGRLAQRGARAQRWVQAEYAWEKSAATLAAFYAELPPAAA